jgi:hypothetical protein
VALFAIGPRQHGRRPRVVDLLLVGAVATLVVAAAVDAARSHRHAAPRPRALTTAAAAHGSAKPLLAATAPVRVALHSSPETSFLPDCRRGRANLWIDPHGPRLVLQRSGAPCHVPALAFHATVRDVGGRVLYRGPALARGGLGAANLAGSEELAAALLPGVLRCDVQGPVRIVVRGGGLVAGGAIHCRGSP